MSRRPGSRIKNKPEKFEPNSMSLMDLVDQTEEESTPSSKENVSPSKTRSPAKKSSRASPKKRASKLDEDAPESWTVDEVTKWLNGFNFGKRYADSFKENDICGSLLQELDDNVLQDELGIDVQLHRKRLLREISDLLAKASLKKKSASPKKVVAQRAASPKKKSASPKKKSAPTRKSAPRSSPKYKPKSPAAKPKPQLPAGKIPCPGCDELVNKGDAMCTSCEYIFPEKKSSAFEATQYFRSYRARPDYRSVGLVTKAS